MSLASPKDVERHLDRPLTDDELKRVRAMIREAEAAAVAQILEVKEQERKSDPTKGWHILPNHDPEFF